MKEFQVTSLIPQAKFLLATETPISDYALPTAKGSV